jgi:putative transposase
LAFSRFFDLPKYRRKVISEHDQMHLLINFPPQVALSALVNSLEGVSSRRLRAANLPEVARNLWGSHFWSPSYCAVSDGRDALALAIVKQFVESQRGSSPP